MYFVKTPKFIQKTFANFVWSVDTDEKTIFLTFDDGPIPHITPWVLEQLRKYDAKATFFCVGDNIKKYPKVLEQVISEGHIVGSHTMNHLNGWETENIQFYHNVRIASNLVEGTLFRPPYGKLMPSQMQFLQRHYEIIMWDVLSGDFDENITPEACLKNVVSKTSNGSIIVFHDSVKAFPRLKYALPKALEYFTSLGYSFKALTPEYIYNKVPQMITA